jgi:hypothetical protein
MNAYIYQADLYCEDCGKKIRQDLLEDGTFHPTLGKLKDANIHDETTYDSDDFPKGPYPDGGGEADTIQCCAGCSCLLENPLTDDGLSASALMLLDNWDRSDRHINKEFWREVYACYPEVVDEAHAMLKEKLTK